MSDHAWTQDHLAAFVAGGLDSAEAERFDAHVAACLACTTALADARRTDAALSRLFAAVHPGPTLEDRLLRSLRTTPKAEPRGQFVWKLGGWKKKLAWGLAASLVLGTTGAMMSRLAEHGDLPFPGMAEGGWDASPGKFIDGHRYSLFGNALHDDRTADHASLDAGVALRGHGEAETMYGYKKELAAPKLTGVSQSEILSSESLTARYREMASAGSLRPNDAAHFSQQSGGFGGSNAVGTHNYRVTSGDSRSELRSKYTEATIGLDPDAIRAIDAAKLDEKNIVDRVTTESKPLPSSDVTVTPYDDLGIVIVRGRTQKDIEEVRKFLDVAQQQQGKQAETQFKTGAAAYPNAVTALNGALPQAQPAQGVPGRAPTGRGGFGGGSGGFGGIPGGGGARPAVTSGPAAPPTQQHASWVVAAIVPSPTPTVPLPAVQFFVPKPNAETLKNFHLAIEAPVNPSLPVPGDGKPKPDAGKGLPELERTEKGDKNKNEGDETTKKPGEQPKPEGKAEPKIPGADGQPAPGTGTGAAQPPKIEAARKIIIRSGDIEYEIESFDNAVAAITKLTTAIPGAFIATVNNEKLANGKMKGVVVVRTPPEHLDQFMLDLRKELTKAGELKGQKIGSSDVTKLYTDMESRLKAARAMETRLLKMIQDGKGDIKQLLEAERELGVWRTKIEELEGELRYYGSLAALSTLTITLVEREIRAASVVTESEVVQSGVEVEDVDLAFREATKAIFDAKGRITKSELKQLTGGQYNATLNFEVAPEQSGAMRDRLKQLGRIARLEINRVITAEGTPPKGLLPKRGDTQFFVQFYNLANIAPRETATASIAVADVPTGYGTLRTAIEKAKGRVLNAQLNETDKANVSATLDFEVKRPEDGAIQIALQGVGETLSRNVTRAAESDAVTDTKVLFRLTLTNASRLTPRETTTVAVAVPDLPTSYKAVLEAVEKAKGRVLTSNLNETDRQNVNATIDFEAKRSDEVAFLTALGTGNEILSRSTTRTAEATNITDSKVLFRVTLSSLARLQPSETLSFIVAVTDIPAGYKAVLAAVEKQKGRVVTANLNEGDRQTVTAQLDFEVKRVEESTVTAAVGPNGDILSRHSVQSPVGSTVTDSKVLVRMTFVSAHRLKPRETATLAIEVENVDTTAAVLASHVADAKGRVVDSQVAAERDGRVTARLIYDVPLASAAGVIEQFKKVGTVRVQQSARDPQATDGKFAIARLDVTLSNQDLIVSPDSGVWPQVRKGLSYSVTALLSSLSWLIFGLFVILPWALIGYVAYRTVRYLFGKPAQAAPAPVPVPTTTATS